MNATKRQRLLKAEAEDLENARYISRADIVIMTESEEDESFWRAMFTNALPESKVMFNYAVQPQDRNSYGKTMCMKYATCTTPNFVLAVDSDFDRFMQKDFPSHPYIFHTVTYSWENHYCWVPALDDWYSGNNHSKPFSFKVFLENLSQILHPYLITLLTAKNNHQKDWSLDKMCSTILSIQTNRKEYQQDNGSQLIDAISKSLKEWSSALQTPSSCDIHHMEQAATSAGENYRNAYLYMQGHCIYDTVCRIGAGLTGMTALQFRDLIVSQNLSIGRYPEINSVVTQIRSQLTQ